MKNTDEKLLDWLQQKMIGCKDSNLRIMANTMIAAEIPPQTIMKSINDVCRYSGKPEYLVYQEEKPEDKIEISSMVLDNVIEMTMEIAEYLPEGKLNGPNLTCSVWEIFKSKVLDWAIEFERVHIEPEDYLEELAQFTRNKFVEEGWLIADNE